MADTRWDSKNRPIGYVLGVTPGFAQFEQGDNRLAYMGFARKITKAARLGFEFAEIDFEQLSEALEPEIGLQVRRIKEAQGIEIGLHLPVEVDLTLADAFSWRYMHEQVRVGAKAAQDIGSKFILFHTSSHMRPNITSLFGRPEPRQRLVGPDGTNLGDWIKASGLQDWFMAKFIKVLYGAMGMAGDPSIIDYFEKNSSFKAVDDEIRVQCETLYKDINIMKQSAGSELNKLRPKKDPSAEDIRKMGEMEAFLNRHWSDIMLEILSRKYGGDEKMAEKIIDMWQTLRRFDFYQVYDYWSKQGSEAEEHVAYLTVAEKMFRKKDPMWKIVRSDKNPYDLAKEATESLGREAFLPEVVKEIVAAVAGEYIRGHLSAGGQQYGIGIAGRDKQSWLSIYDFCKSNRIHIFIETAMPERGGEGGELRLIRVMDHVNIIKSIDNGENISYCMDFEHLITNLVDPIKEAMSIGAGDGKYIRMIHLNAPRPLTGAHAPIEPMSLDMLIIYKWLYSLKKAGMTDAYLLWEMGSYGVRQSAIAFRNIIGELSKNPPTDPKDLKPEFFGIDEEMKARQMVSIRQHAFDPIKGLMVVPEEEWTMLGEIARRRGKLGEWEKRKYR